MCSTFQSFVTFFTELLELKLASITASATFGHSE